MRWTRLVLSTVLDLVGIFHVFYCNMYFLPSEGMSSSERGNEALGAHCKVAICSLGYACLSGISSLNSAKSRFLLSDELIEDCHLSEFLKGQLWRAFLFGMQNVAAIG